LKVSTAEELLREPDPAARRELADQAVEERWERRQVRAALTECKAALQLPDLARRLNALATELGQINSAALSQPERRAMKRLLTRLRRLTRQSDPHSL